MVADIKVAYDLFGEQVLEGFGFLGNREHFKIMLICFNYFEQERRIVSFAGSVM
jgi:hypothetical protein